MGSIPREKLFLDGLVVRIFVSYVEGPGSIPGWGKPFPRWSSGEDIRHSHWRTGFNSWLGKTFSSITKWWGYSSITWRDMVQLLVGENLFLDCLVVRIFVTHMEGPGSIPGWGEPFPRWSSGEDIRHSHGRTGFGSWLGKTFSSITKWWGYSSITWKDRVQLLVGENLFLDCLVVRIFVSHVEGPGSIPSWGDHCDSYFTCHFFVICCY